MCLPNREMPLNSDAAASVTCSRCMSMKAKGEFGALVRSMCGRWSEEVGCREVRGPGAANLEGGNRD